MNQAQLAAEYPALQVYSTSNTIGHGNRVVYWVGGDGKQCVVFNSVGEQLTAYLNELDLTSVVNAVDHSFEGGRLRYKRSLESTWIDAGPLDIRAVRPDDPSLRNIKKNIGKQLSFEELTAGEECDDSWEDDGW